jgi:hypothetical protein
LEYALCLAGSSLDGWSACNCLLVAAEDLVALLPEEMDAVEGGLLGAGEEAEADAGGHRGAGRKDSVDVFRVEIDKKKQIE